VRRAETAHLNAKLRKRHATIPKWHFFKIQSNHTERLNDRLFYFSTSLKDFVDTNKISQYETTRKQETIRNLLTRQHEKKSSLTVRSRCHGGSGVCWNTKF
jgi:hypothetical protein